MNILHLITLGAAAFNVVRKVLGKRDLTTNIYSSHITSIDSYKLYKKYDINMKPMFVAFLMGDKLLYSFINIYVPDVIVKSKAWPSSDYYFDVAVAAQKAIMEDQFGHNRLGKGHDLCLVESIPSNVMNTCRSKNGYRLKRGFRRIKDEYSVYNLAHYVGGRPQLRGMILEIVRFMYNKYVIDGVIPRDCVTGLDV